MQTENRDNRNPKLAGEIPSNLPANQGGPSLPLQEYVVTSTEKLDYIAQLIGWGETIGPEAHRWMLEQVDFIVDKLGTEEVDTDGDLRTSLLKLLLEIANLNEHVRHEGLLSV